MVKIRVFFEIIVFDNFNKFDLRKTFHDWPSVTSNDPSQRFNQGLRTKICKIWEWGQPTSLPKICSIQSSVNGRIDLQSREKDCKP